MVQHKGGVSQGTIRVGDYEQDFLIQHKMRHFLILKIILTFFFLSDLSFHFKIDLF